MSRVPSQKIAREVFPEVPDLHDLSRSASLLLSNSYFSLTGSKPSVPAHVEVGGIHISPEASPLPQVIIYAWEASPAILCNILLIIGYPKAS